MKIVPEEGAVVDENDIHYYDYKELSDHIYSHAKNGGVGGDLAISEKDTADYTGLISGIVVKEEGRDVIYILPTMIHERLDLYKTIRGCQTIKDTMPNGTKFFIEDVAYQKAAIKEMKRKGIPAIGIRPITDKRARFETVAIHIKSGLVKFADKGLEDLIVEMLGFGIEDHDDLVDALVYLILGLTGKKQGSAGVGKGDAM